MKKYLLFLVLFSISFLCNFSFAQNSAKHASNGFGVQVTHAQFLGKTPPLRELVPLQGTTQERREYGEKFKSEVPNFVGRKRPTEAHQEGALPRGEDPVLQKSFSRNAAAPLEPMFNIDGMDQATANNVNPPDVCGDIGNNFFIQMVNASYFQVFDKEGNPVADPIAMNTIWSQVGELSRGDPIILYDQEADRWIITEFPFGNRLLFAISETADPFGSWAAYTFSTPLFPDYPKYSIWPNAYCVTTNEEGAGTLVNYFINRDEILNGAPAPTIQRITLPGVIGGPNFFVSTPVDWTGETPPPTDAKPMVLRLEDDGWGSFDTDGITSFEFDIDWDNSNNTSVETFFTPTAPFNTAACLESGLGFECIPQLDGNGIDGIPEVIMHQVHYRNFETYEAMVLNFLVNADGNPVRAGIRWMELRRQDGGNWSVYQEGTYAPDDDLHRFMGGIAMDGNGNIGLGFSFSSPNDHPGLGFTGRKASDPLGVMTAEEYTITEGFSVNSSDRFGDYSQMVVDPANERTFWYTGEYRKSEGWGTKIVSFEMERDTIDLGPIGLDAPLSSPNLTDAEEVIVAVKNFGVDTLYDFEVGYIFENESPIIELVNTVLLPDSTYSHSFSGSSVDMSGVGDYEFILFTNLNMDESPINDTLRLVRSKLPRFDAGITGIQGLDGQPCGLEVPATIVLTNFGSEILTNVTIEISTNGVTESINWVGNLPSGASEEVDITVSNLLDGTNEISASSFSPNGMADEVPNNDSFIREFEAVVNGVQVNLLLFTDTYSNETTWDLVNESGIEIYSGGPYMSDNTLLTTEWCLAPEGCYEFTIFDSANDGICCIFGEGYVTIQNADGETIVSSDGQFGSSETLEFCTDIVGCQLTADIVVTPTSMPGSSDGAIMITPQNGSGPYLFSNDLGANFQGENIFDNLPGGDYGIVVTGTGDCLYTDTVTVPECAILFSVEITPETSSNSGDGAIEILAFNGNGNFSYSTDGGETFQSSPVFTGLSTGDYEVIVKDEAGCTNTGTVNVGIVNGVGEVYSGVIIQATPNPTDGVFQLNIRGLEVKSSILPVKIFSASGQLVQSTYLGRYDGVFTGQISLVEFASGTYFIKLDAEEVDRMVRVVRK